MQDARLLQLSLDRASRFFQDHDTAGRAAFMSANAVAIAKLTPRTLAGLLVKTSVLSEAGAPAAVATHRAALKQFMSTFSARDFVRDAESNGYTFQLYPRLRAPGWQYSADRPRGRHRAYYDYISAIQYGPAGALIRKEVTAYLVERETKRGTVPDRHAFDAEAYVREIEASGGGFQLKPTDDGEGWDFWFLYPDERSNGRCPTLFQSFQIHSPKNRRAITALLIRRAKASGEWQRFLDWRANAADASVQSAPLQKAA